MRATPEAFAAFADAVLGADPSDAAKETLKLELDAWHLRFDTLIERSLPEPAWGPSRLDAVSMIFNRLAGLDIGEPPTYLIPDNIARADAPTRYPFLWNAPIQDKTQWPGFADNGNDILGLSRNLGEVYGVFGVFHPVEQRGTYRLNRDYLANNSANFTGLARWRTRAQDRPAAMAVGARPPAGRPGRGDLQLATSTTAAAPSATASGAARSDRSFN